MYWLKHTMTIAKLNARDLIVDLLLGLQGREISIKQIIIAARLFEISENSIRVAVTRLSSEGVIEAIERGVYQFTNQSREWADVMLNRKMVLNKPNHGISNLSVYLQGFGKSRSNGFA